MTVLDIIKSIVRNIKSPVHVYVNSIENSVPTIEIALYVNKSESIRFYFTEKEFVANPKRLLLHIEYFITANSRNFVENDWDSED